MFQTHSKFIYKPTKVKGVPVKRWCERCRKNVEEKALHQHHVMRGAVWSADSSPACSQGQHGISKSEAEGSAADLLAPDRVFLQVWQFRLLHLLKNSVLSLPSPRNDTCEVCSKPWTPASFSTSLEGGGRQTSLKITQQLHYANLSVHSSLSQGVCFPQSNHSNSEPQRLSFKTYTSIYHGSILC